MQAVAGLTAWEMGILKGRNVHIGVMYYGDAQVFTYHCRQITGWDNDTILGMIFIVSFPLKVKHSFW